jgi:hypothetical protein
VRIYCFWVGDRWGGEGALAGAAWDVGEINSVAVSGVLFDGADADLFGDSLQDAVVPAWVLHGMILLAGVGAVAMVRMMPQLSLRYIVAAILVVPAGNLAYQAWRINFKYVADARHNPYLYSMPGADFLRLVNRVEELAKVSPARGKMFIRVVSSDCWPLPWYLRGFERVEYWNTSSGRDPFAEVVIGKAADGDLEARLGGDFVGESFGLRRGVVMTVYVEKKLWEEFRKGRR